MCFLDLCSLHSEPGARRWRILGNIHGGVETPRALEVDGTQKSEEKATWTMCSASPMQGKVFRETGSEGNPGASGGRQWGRGRGEEGR